MAYFLSGLTRTLARGVDFAKPLCQPCARRCCCREEEAMKVHVEIDCTPEEARTFLGLPDVGKANEFYVDAIGKAMKGAGSVEQIQEFAKGLAPMGQVGMNLFKSFMENSAAFSSGAKKKSD
jgi:Family of unknown function (DUF6489)